MFCGLYIISTATQWIYRSLFKFLLLCLNFCSLKSLKAKSKPCNKANSSKVMTILLETEFEDGRMNLRILVLKTEKLPDFLKRGSKLFHSVMVDVKTEFLKK